MTYALLFMWLAAPPQDASGWIELARAQQRSGDFAGMKESSRRARELCPQAGGDGCLAQAWNLEGTALYFRGAYEEALQRYETALGLFTRRGDGEQQAYVLNNIGSIRFVQGRYEEALRAYRDAETVYRSPTRAKWRDEAEQLTKANLAALLQRLGRYEAALTIYREIGAKVDALPGDERAQWLTNLGGLLRRLGDPYKAGEQYEKALKLYDAERNLDARLGTLRNLGILEALELGRLESAERRFRTIADEAERAGDAREGLQATLFLAETRWRRGAIAEAEELWRTAAAKAERLKAPEEQWKALYGMGRTARRRGEREQAIGFLESAVRVIEGLRAKLKGAELRGDYLGDKRDVYDERVELELERGPGSGGEVVRWVERARERRVQDSNHAGKVELPDGVPVVVFWVRGGRAARMTWSSGRWTTTELRMPEKPAEVFERDFRQWSDSSRDQWRVGSRRWGTILLGGLEGARLVIIPDGFLARMPFEALEVGAGGELAGERFQISYAPSLSFASRTGIRRMQPPWALQAVGVGAAAAGEWLVPGDEARGRLPGARREMSSLARNLPGRVELYAGEQASAPQVLTALASAKVVHVATHAVADMEDERRSRLLLARDKGSKSYLFLNELVEIRTHGLELATLSACETEAGRAVAGEGVASFGRALLAAGAESVVSSLWRVDDRATARLMEVFYRELGQGKGRAAALAEAHRAMIRSGGETAHPANWAGFVLMGEGDAPLSPVIGWPAILSAAGVALALGGLLLMRKRQ